LFPDGRLGFASRTDNSTGTKLSSEKAISVEEIAEDPQFEPAAILPDEFEQIWRQATEAV
jgi:hypothetical protein